jgi:hypothetical protein
MIIYLLRNMIDEKTENRFWSKIETSNHYDECYNVISMQKTKSGHYLFYYKSKKVLAHHFSYELHTNKKPQYGKRIIHTCQNKMCVNPNHLCEM